MSQRPYQGSRGGGGISEFQAYNDQGNGGGGGGGGYSRGGRGGGGGGGNDYYNNRNNNRNDNRNYHRQKQQDQGYDNFKDGGDYGSQSSQQLSNSGEEAVVQKITFAVVCASNQNRSMSAHYLLQKKYRMNVSSFGTGSSVKLPGRTRDTPNIYDFGTSYQDIFNDLKSQDEEYYTRLGLLKMLTRNAQIKRAPEKWQENINHFDVVITFEDRVFDAVIESMIANQTMYDRPTHIININVKDTPEEAERNAKYIAEFAKRLNESEDWENDVKHEIVKFEQQYGEKLMHLVLFA